MICICKSGSLSHGKVTEQKTFVFAVTGVLTLLSYPSCFLYNWRSALPQVPFCKDVRSYLCQLYWKQRLANVFCEGWARARMCRPFPPPCLTGVFYCRDDTSPEAVASAAFCRLNRGRVEKESADGGFSGASPHPQLWQGAALVSLFYFWTGGGECFHPGNQILLVSESRLFAPSIFWLLGISLWLWNKFDCRPLFSASGVRNVYLLCVFPATPCESHLKYQPGSSFLITSCFSVLSDPDLGMEWRLWTHTPTAIKHWWDITCRVAAMVFTVAP